MSKACLKALRRTLNGNEHPASFFGGLLVCNQPKDRHNDTQILNYAT